MIIVSVLEELKAAGLEWQYGVENEVLIACPFHGDETPSCSINTEKQVFKCHAASCGKSGDIATLLARITLQPRHAIIAYFEDKYGVDGKDLTVNANVVEGYHKRIWQATPLLAELHKRAVTDDIIRRYRLGEDKGRITIPITNAQGVFVNVRRYAPGLKGGKKMINMRGRGKPRLYPFEQLKHDVMLVCGGEVKALAAIPELNEHNIGCISSTGGEENWDANMSSYFKGKTVYVCYDIDEAGKRQANFVCASLSSVAEEVYRVDLPLDLAEYPHGDINDWLALGHQLWPLLQAADIWHLEPAAGLESSPEDPIGTAIDRLTDPRFANKRVEVDALISAIDERPYLIPKEIIPKCNRDQPQCALCPVFTMPPDKCKFLLPPESIAMLEMLKEPTKNQRDIIRRALAIPPCKPVTFHPSAYYSVEESLIASDLSALNLNTRKEGVHAICVDTKVELNETYRVIGTVRPHPRTQRATVVVSNSKSTADALSRFVLHDPDDLNIFKSADTPESIQDRLDSIYEDFEANVTRIYARRDLHLLMDLTYHSVLHIPFHDRHARGWIETLIVGDSSIGKSETSTCLMNHYNLGQQMDCKNATVAGMLGGLDSIDGQWFVKWGIIPTNDRRLVILEELKGLNIEVFSKLTDMRSRGVAELPKIERRKTHARTRIIALSNPRGPRIAAYGFGVDAIREVVGSPEDIRRFDACMVIADDDVPYEMLAESPPVCEHTYTSELCRRLVLWSWTRKHNEVVFEDTQFIAQKAMELSKQFSEAIPIVDRGSMRLKLARLSAALACRVFSTDDNTHVQVKNCHVEYVCDFLQRIYTHPACGYDRFTEAANRGDSVKDPDKVRVEILATPYPDDLISSILATTKIDVRDVQDWCGWSIDEANSLVSLLVRKRALTRDGRFYRKTQGFIELLQTVKPGTAVRPDYLEDHVERF